jgi:hypothetical protein
MHPDGNWKITRFIKGESLKDYLIRNKGVIEPAVEAQLRKAVDDMLSLSKITNTKLDLSVDNLKIWNGKVYLIDAGPIPPDVSHPLTYDAFVSKWKGQMAPSLGAKCKNLLSALKLLKPI